MDMAKEQYADLNNTEWGVGSMSNPKTAVELEAANAVIARQTTIIEEQGALIASLRQQLKQTQQLSVAPAQMRADRAEKSAFPRPSSGIY